jgi:hypothetical protein
MNRTVQTLQLESSPAIRSSVLFSFATAIKLVTVQVVQPGCALIAWAWECRPAKELILPGATVVGGVEVLAFRVLALAVPYCRGPKE